MQTLKQITSSKHSHIFAITEILLKDNEMVNIQHFTWIGLNRQNKDGGGIGFSIRKSIIKSCAIEPNLHKTIEFMSKKLNLSNNESMVGRLYYGKQESKSTKEKNRKTNLIKYQHKQKTVLIMIHMYSYLVILMPKQVMTRKA